MYDMSQCWYLSHTADLIPPLFLRSDPPADLPATIVCLCAAVTATYLDPNVPANTVYIVEGYMRAGMKPENFECRIINPGFKDTIIGKRWVPVECVAALRGFLSPAPRRISGHPHDSSCCCRPPQHLRVTRSDRVVVLVWVCGGRGLRRKSSTARACDVSAAPRPLNSC